MTSTLLSVGYSPSQRVENSRIAVAAENDPQAVIPRSEQTFGSGVVGTLTDPFTSITTDITTFQSDGTGPDPLPAGPGPPFSLLLPQPSSPQRSPRASRLRTSQFSSPRSSPISRTSSPDRFMFQTTPKGRQNFMVNYYDTQSQTAGTSNFQQERADPFDELRRSAQASPSHLHSVLHMPMASPRPRPRGLGPDDSDEEDLQVPTSPARALDRPIYQSSFVGQSNNETDTAHYRKRLALAMDMDPASRLRKIRSEERLTRQSTARWEDSAWRDTDGDKTLGKAAVKKRPRKVLSVAYRVLEAPNLRDDFYCSLLAYSPTIDCLAVGLGEKLYLWHEKDGVKVPPEPIENKMQNAGYITCVTFSSASGNNAILAVGRADGIVVMYSPKDTELRLLQLTVVHPVSNICFRPLTVSRPSQHIAGAKAECEVLLVGDETGAIHVYFVEWPQDEVRKRYNWHGGLVLHRKISMHSQQVCGMAWSPDGKALATGGNDNVCYLINFETILSPRNPSSHVMPNRQRPEDDDRETLTILQAQHAWQLQAAVKAIAFCPWQKGLLAAGGGSNDRGIHFFHYISGTCLATIDCAAQVTTVMWARTRREIVATLGFAQPDHPYRIAVFSWPRCEQIAAVSWHDEMRALCAVPYPRGPVSSSGLRPRSQRRSSKASSGSASTVAERTALDSSVVVAASDGSIKFYELWKGRKSLIRSQQAGGLAGSAILESLHGVESPSGSHGNTCTIR